MNYELAKELNDAGFPQPKRWGTVLENCTCGSSEYMSGNKVHAPNSDCLLIEPNLEELIEACGDKLHFITRVHDDIWEAGARDSFYDAGSGKTPIEAVARLWLALNPTH